MRVSFSVVLPRITLAVVPLYFPAYFRPCFARQLRRGSLEDQAMMKRVIAHISVANEVRALSVRVLVTGLTLTSGIFLHVLVI